MTILKGIVISTKMNKTAVIRVDRSWRHPLYRKTVKRSKSYLVHSQQKLEEGDEVRIVPCRPISKLVKWKVVNKQ